MKRLSIMMILFAVGCSVDPNTLQETLQDEGYYDIHDDGYAMFGCSKDDDFASNFHAKRRMPDGTEREVSGVVCCGFLKDCTVRH